MKQVNNNFEYYYYLTENGEVFNKKTGKFLKHNKKYIYTLKTIDDKYTTISLKTLYKLVYEKIFCIDNISDLEGEQWRKIKDSKDYYISNYGRIKSYNKGIKATLLKPYITTRGYKRIDIIYIDGARRSKFVHSLVAEEFLVTPIPCQDYEVHHKDGNKLNNNANNLCYCSPLEHRQKHKELKERRNKENECTKSAHSTNFTFK